MLSLTTTVILSAVCFAPCFGLELQDCDLEHYTPMAGFKPQKFQGRWYPAYEIHSAPYESGALAISVDFEYRSYTNELSPDKVQTLMIDTMTFTYSGGRCVVTKQVDRVDNGVFYAGHKVTPDGDIRWDRMIVLDTDYVSTAAVVYEVFINGVLSDEDSELVLLVRDYDRTLNMTAVAGGLERFCGPQAASADVFQIHAFNWKAGCGNYEVKLG